MSRRLEIIAQHVSARPAASSSSSSSAFIERGSPNNKPAELREGRTPLPDNPHIVGNFGPVSTEGHFTNLKVEGKIPDDMGVGQYLRIGPNPKFDFSNDRYHSFDGDGFVHAVAFPGEGRPPTYTKRWVRTRRLLTATARGFDVAEMGEQAFGAFDYFEHVRDSSLPGSTEPGHRMGKANTSMVAHAGRLLALEEQDKPYELVGSFDGESNLRTVGRWDFAQKLRHPVTAHPKLDAQTGELMFFGYDPMNPVVRYSVASSGGGLLRTLDIPLPAPVMMHDMVITKEWSILFDMRMEFVLQNAMEGKNPWNHRRDVPARFGVLPRHATDPNEIRWIDVSPCAVFHFANAWTEPNDPNKIIIVGSRIPTVNFNRYEDTLTGQVDPAAKPDYSEENRGHLHVWELDLRGAGRCTKEYAFSDHGCDFLNVRWDRVGVKTRYVYAQHFVEKQEELPRPEYANSLFIVKGLLKYDLETGKVMKVNYESSSGTPLYGTEAVFAPSSDENAKDEDDGTVVVYAYDEAQQKSQCIVYDAKTLEVKARVHLPGRVPYGFHGIWQPASSMR